MTNFATLVHDPEAGLDFITDVETRERLYKHPNCALCGVPRYSRRVVLPDCDETCATHPKRREMATREELFG